LSVRRLESRLRLSQEESLPNEESISTENPIGYYYPEVLTPLDTAVTAGGTLFSAALGGQNIAAGTSDSTSQENGEGGHTTEPPEGLRPPEEDSEEARSSSNKQDKQNKQN
jgi:hypothetical protein